MLDDLIAPMQRSFIPGRQADDNILIAQELIHTIKRSKSKNGLMAVKIDLEKAYDRVRWDFLKDTLIAFVFPDSCISLIMFCISLIMFCVESSHMAVLLNGEQLEKLKPGRGQAFDKVLQSLTFLCFSWRDWVK